MMRKLRNKRAQNIIEYAIIIGLVTAALAAISTYVLRSIQATQKVITDEAQKR